MDPSSSPGPFEHQWRDWPYEDASARCHRVRGTADGLCRSSRHYRGRGQHTDIQPITASAKEPSAERSASSSDQTADNATEIIAVRSAFGTMLFDDTGQAVYLFDVETTSEPRCYDACADPWPPVLTDSDPLAGEGVQPSLLGTTHRTDGMSQVAGVVRKDFPRQMASFMRFCESRTRP
jgi:predicted lipoprotein with Yx(FWY)xxD motif